MKTKTYKGHDIYAYMTAIAVIHFLSIQEVDEDDGLSGTTIAYNRALSKAKPFGGRKFHNKSFGGGIAFNSIEACQHCLDKYGRGDEDET